MVPKSEVPSVHGALHLVGPIPNLKHLTSRRRCCLRVTVARFETAGSVRNACTSGRRRHPLKPPSQD